MTKQPFAHDAVLALAADDDERAPGGAITVALCGSSEHEPPCPLAPHHTAADRDGDSVLLRILFAAEPADEARVRALIDEALAARWQVVSSGRSAVRPAEADHAERLTRS